MKFEEVGESQRRLEEVREGQRRFEEGRGSSKKNRESGKIIAWKNTTNKVINLHAIQSQNISKFTSNISKHTSKFTSKTN